jgi:hypothetical protein
MVDVGKNTVEQYGPRRLWDDVERAYGEWEGAGRPCCPALRMPTKAALRVPMSAAW